MFQPLSLLQRAITRSSRHPKITGSYFSTRICGSKPVVEWTIGFIISVPATVVPQAVAQRPAIITRIRTVNGSGSSQRYVRHAEKKKRWVRTSKSFRDLFFFFFIFSTSNVVENKESNLTDITATCYCVPHLFTSFLCFYSLIVQLYRVCNTGLRCYYCVSSRLMPAVMVRRVVTTSLVYFPSPPHPFLVHSPPISLMVRSSRRNSRLILTPLHQERSGSNG